MSAGVSFMAFIVFWHALTWTPLFSASAMRCLTGESALFVRSRRDVVWRAIDVGEAEFLAACAAGQSCDDALESVLAGGSGFDLAVSLPRLLRACAFTRIDGDAA